MKRLFSAMRSNGGGRLAAAAAAAGAGDAAAAPHNVKANVSNKAMVRFAYRFTSSPPYNRNIISLYSVRTNTKTCWNKLYTSTSKKVMTPMPTTVNARFNIVWNKLY